MPIVVSKFQIKPYSIRWVSKIHRGVVPVGHDPKSSVFFMHSFKFRPQQAVKPTPALLNSAWAKVLLTEFFHSVAPTPIAGSNFGGFCAHYSIPKVSGL
jgi:hypothetical protein